MATYANQTKNSSTFANAPKASQSLDWDHADFTWDGAGEATWDDPQAYQNQAKNVSVFTPQVKN